MQLMQTYKRIYLIILFDYSLDATTPPEMWQQI